MNDKAEKDWVTARCLCSLPNVFKALRSQVEEDVKARNALRPNNSPYWFSVTESGDEFAVVLEAKDTNRQVSNIQPCRPCDLRAGFAGQGDVRRDPDLRR
jgi:hypothetical protein